MKKSCNVCLVSQASSWEAGVGANREVEGEIGQGWDRPGSSQTCQTARKCGWSQRRVGREKQGDILQVSGIVGCFLFWLVLR